jgi:hypothetical protein
MYKTICIKLNFEYQEPKAASPKEVLCKYGGKIDIDTYRKNFITCDRSYRLMLPPLMSITHMIEEISIDRLDSESTVKINLNQIKKKISSAKNNLFNTMGIKNKK